MVLHDQAHGITWSDTLVVQSEAQFVDILTSLAKSEVVVGVGSIDQDLELSVVMLLHVRMSPYRLVVIIDTVFQSISDDIQMTGTCLSLPLGDHDCAPRCVNDKRMWTIEVTMIQMSTRALRKRDTNNEWKQASDLQ